MKICLIYLSGSKKGQIECYIEGPVTLGTGKDNVSHFSPDEDKKVSLKHAVISEDDGKIFISDAGSKSGTLVNGEKIDARRELKDWDVIDLGRNGVRFIYRLNEAPRINPKTGDVLEEEMMKMISASLLKMKGKQEGRLAPGTVFFRQLIERSVKRSTVRFKIAISLMTILLCVVIALWIGQTLKDKKRANEELNQRMAEINQAWEYKLKSFEQRNLEFSDTATARESELRARILELEDKLGTEATNKSDERNSLRAELRRVQAELNRTRRELMKNTRTDFVAIAKANQSAVLMIANNYQVYDKKTDQPLMVTGKDPQGRPIIQIGGTGTPLRDTATGTGFCVDADGYIITNRHVVKPWEMQPFFLTRGLIGKTLKLQVIFADTDEWIDVEIYKESSEHDIVVLKIKSSKKKYPFIKKMQSDVNKLNQGEEIAVLGFPANVKTDGKAVTTLTVGVLSKIPLKEDLQFNAQINPGSSGGPIFNGSGEVIGVVYGAGIDITGERLQGISYAIPIKYALDILKK